MHSRYSTHLHLTNYICVILIDRYEDKDIMWISRGYKVVLADEDYTVLTR
jgi:hypothetical protein